MTNWNQQVEATMKSWSEMQKKTWDTFFSSMQGMTKSQEARAWESTLGMGETMLKDLFKAQADWLAAWVDGLAKVEGLPAPVLESARQFQEMTTQWNKTQAELLGNWFAMLKKLAPVRPGDSWSELPQSMFKTWQDATATIMDTQQKWMRSWMDTLGKKSDE